jgi:hypothetical protein
MKSSDLLDRTVASADAEQTGVRFEDSRIRLQVTTCMGCNPIQQFMTVEVCKSLGSAANE